MNFQLRYQKAVEAKQQRVGGRCNEKDGGISGVLGAGKRQVQGTWGKTCCVPYCGKKFKKT